MLVDDLARDVHDPIRRPLVGWQRLDAPPDKLLGSLANRRGKHHPLRVAQVFLERGIFPDTRAGLADVKRSGCRRERVGAEPDDAMREKAPVVAGRGGEVFVLVHPVIRRATPELPIILPTREEVQGFLADAAPDKRERLIDRLIVRPEFAEHWALKWSDLLRNEEKVLDQKGVDLFYGWIRESIAAGKPLDQFVREMVDAQGSTYANPPANFWRANRDPFTRGETAARLFLGVRLQCAKCHNHPFDRWTQDDYYSWAALFGQIDYKEVGENKRSDKLDLHEFNGEQIVLARTNREVKDPRTGQDAAPKFLGGEILSLEPASNRLPPLAQWLASPANELAEIVAT